MKTFCDYCGSAIDDTLDRCPNCGAVNQHMQRSGNQVPKTIEELQAFAAANNIPLEKMRFFVGVDYKEPRAFGIYKEPNGNCVVYKNKADGSRAIRYQGADEAYAVNELYQKMKAEVLDRKEADLNKGRTTSRPKPARSSSRKRNSGCGGLATGCSTGIVIFLVIMIMIVAFVNSLEDAKTPKKGYYEYNGTPYYYTGGAWYTPDDDGEWERDYDAPDRLEENYNDYFEAKDYSSLDSDYAGEVEEYPTEAYSNDSYDNDDSWNDSNWDDDDWDYDYDSYDSYDSDWDSDW